MTQIHNDSQRAPKAQLHIDLPSSVVTDGRGVRYELSRKFFELYVRLALQRRKHGDGYVDSSTIHFLPQWMKTTPGSVGKEISRHVHDMDRLQRNVIETKSRQRIKGPFRIALLPENIVIHGDLEEVAAYLNLHVGSPETIEDAERLYCFVDGLAEGNLAFDAGDLDDALSAFARAAGCAGPLEQRVVQLKIARIHVRRKKYDAALEVYRDLLALLQKESDGDYLAKATICVHMAWLHCIRGELPQAEHLACDVIDESRTRRHYEVMGHAFNALARVRELTRQFTVARSYYQKALDYFSLTDYIYGVTAAYHNLGRLERIIGDQDLAATLSRNRRAGITFAANNTYLRAQKMVQQCLDLAKKARVGGDTSKDHIEMARIAARLGDTARARNLVERAEAMARRAGHPVDLAMAQAVREKIEKYSSTNDLMDLIEGAAPTSGGLQDGTGSTSVEFPSYGRRTFRSPAESYTQSPSSKSGPKSSGKVEAKRGSKRIPG